MAAITSTAAVAPARTVEKVNVVRGFTGLKRASGPLAPKAATFQSKTVSNGAVTKCFQVVNPDTNTRFETLSYLPPLSSQSIARQVEYLLRKGWIPCIEFDKVGVISRENSKIPGYYDGRYWSLWKLPLFGCTSADQVLAEIGEAVKAYPNSYIRVGAFDNKKQVQCVSFIVYKPRK